MREQICSYYEKLYIETCENMPRLTGLAMVELDDDSACSLKLLFMEEVKRAILDCDGDKTLDPNGFTIAFLRKNWDVIKQDIIAVPNDFHSIGKNVKSTNSTFICLIFKKGAYHISNF